MINMFHSESWFPVICFGAHRKTSFWVVPLGPLGGLQCQIYMDLVIGSKKWLNDMPYMARWLQEVSLC